MTDEKSKAENTFHKKIGKTNYKVTVHFSETSNETITDKINKPAPDGQRHVVDGVDRVGAQQPAGAGAVDDVDAAQLDDRVGARVPVGSRRARARAHRWASPARTASSSGVMA